MTRGFPAKAGFELRRELAPAQRPLPITFTTAHGDIPVSVQGIKGSAIEFLMKPLRDQDLLEAIQLGHVLDHAWLEHEDGLAELRACFEALTSRERDVMACGTSRLLNKQIAADLGLSEITWQGDAENEGFVLA